MGDVKGPDADIDLPKGDVSGGIGFGMKGRKGSHSSTSSSSSEDEDGKKKKKKKKKGGFGFGFNMPKIHGPNFGGGAKGGIDAKGPSGDLDIDGKAKLGAEVPDVDANMKKPDLDANVSAGGDVKLPSGGGDVKLPSGDVNVKGPDADVDVKRPDADIDLPKGDVSGGIGFGMKGRKGSHSSTSSRALKMKTLK